MVADAVAVAKKGKWTKSLGDTNKTTVIGVPPPAFKIYAEPPHKPKIRNPDSTASTDPKKSIALYSGRQDGSAIGFKSGITLKNSEMTFKVKTHVGRKVLADISNVKGSFSRIKVQDSSKSLRIYRNSVGGTGSASSTSDKPSAGNLRTNLIQASGNHHTLKKAASKHAKATASDDFRAKIQGHKLLTITNSRQESTSGRNDLPPTRKSVPVLKPVIKANTRDVKEESTGRSDRGKGKYGFPVKPKVGRNMVAQESNIRSQLWRGRVSDGYVTMVSKGQHNVDVGALSKKSLKPLLKTTTTVTKSQKTSKPENSSGLNKLATCAAISSKRKEDIGKSSSSEHIASVVPNGQPAQQDVSFCSKSNSDRTTADTATRRKSGRRKSFTSLLVSKPQEDLPNIYDVRNHLEVTEYVDDIYQYYWVMEAQNQVLKHYMEIQTEITPQMRGILINWLIEVHLKFDLMQETLFLMVTLLDQYLSLVSIKKSEMQLVGLTALLLASKYEDFWHPRIMDLISISAESYTRDQMLGMESSFLKTLKFRLNAPTSYLFMLRFLKASQSDTKFEHLAFYLIELCLVEYEALNYKPSLLCASAIYIARCTMQVIPAWTPLLGKHSHYEESQLRNCSEMILKFHKAAKTALLKVTYEKYMRPEFSSVAAIKPLEMLPHRCA